MDLDQWNGDFQLAGDWDLFGADLNVIGQLGDLKQLSPDDVQSYQSQDGISDISHFKEVDGLGLSDDWMESTDIASFFDALEDHPANLLETSFLNIDTDFIAETSSKSVGLVPNLLNSVGKTDRVQQPSNCIASLNLSPPEFEHQHLIQPNHSSSQHSLSPPESPKDYCAKLKGLDTVIIVPKIIVKGEEIAISGGDIVLEVQGDDSTVLSQSEVSSDSSNSLLSFPSSPESTCSIIKSSPELFKVISSSTDSNRFSPYGLQKSKQDSKYSKRARKTKAPAQPVPEHVIMEETNKKDRKKLQNKNAAIRYRLKKKEEAEVIKSEEEELEEINLTLKTKVEDLGREIVYMKNLMQDIFRAKGIKIDIVHS